QVNSATLNTYVPLLLGNHLLTVQAWDTTGATFKTNVNVAMTPPCVLNKTNRSITICTPSANSVVSSPVHLVAGVTDSSPVVSFQVGENGKVLFTATSAPLDVYLQNLAPGLHSFTLTAKDLNGNSYSKNVSVTVSGNTGINNIRHIIF